jgi:hypothetical protein
MEDKQVLVMLIAIIIGTIGAGISSLDNTKIEILKYQKIDNIDNITNNLTKFGDVAKDINNSISNIIPELIPSEIPYPKPTYVPNLRPYEIDKSHDLWHAKDPSSYIEPNNEWVRFYASQLFVDYDGYIKYKNEKQVWWVDINGTEYYTNKSLQNNYIYDWEQLGNGAKGSLANDDYWTNADYYLTHGMKGDCEEWAITVTSMMLSGEMSVWQEDKLVKQIIPAKVVMGYVSRVYDGWVEYQVYNKDWITSTSREKDYYGEPFSATIFIEKDPQFEPVFEFTNTYFRGYRKRIT